MNKETHQAIHLILLSMVLATMLFWQWLSSFMVILLTVHWMVEGDWGGKMGKLQRSPLLWPMIAFFLLHLAWLPFCQDFHAAWFEAEKKLAFLVFPVVCGSRKYSNRDLNRLLAGWFLAVSTVSLYCMARAAGDFLITGKAHYLFDFRLSSYTNLHAGYFAVYVITAIVFSIQLIEKGAFSSSVRLAIVILTSVLVFFLVLLSSKLIVSVGLLVVFWYLLQKLEGSPRIIGGIVTIAIMVVVYFIPRPQGDDIIDSGSIDKEIKSSNLSDGMNDGLSIRLSLWKSGANLLTREGAWLLGLGPVSSTEMLKGQLSQPDEAIYVLLQSRPDRIVNMHNQLMESALRLGLVGFLVLLLILSSGIFVGLKTNSLLVTAVSAIFLVFFFSESALERQMGVVPFAIFISLILSEFYNGGEDKPDNQP